MSAITEMVAGRELDALIAERVMGACAHRDIKNWYREGPDGDRTLHCGACHQQPTVPRYSTSIADAWLVVERCGLSVVQSDDGWYAVKPEDIHHSSVRGTAYPTITLVYPEQQYPEPADTPALAICRAALEAHR